MQKKLLLLGESILRIIIYVGNNQAGRNVNEHGTLKQEFEVSFLSL